VLYLRSADEGPAVALQENAIKDHVSLHGQSIDRVWIDTASFSVPLDERRELKSFIHSLEEGDRLYLYDLEAVTPKAGELLQFLHCIFEHGLQLVVARYGIVIDKETPSGVIVRLLNALRQKRRQRAMGRPRGSISRSKYDRYRDFIIEMIKEGRSVSEIAKELGASRSSIRDYIASRNLKEIALGTKPPKRRLPGESCKIDERIVHGDGDEKL